MKIQQDTTQFQPVTITLESVSELCAICNAIYWGRQSMVGSVEVVHADAALAILHDLVRKN